MDWLKNLSLRQLTWAAVVLAAVIVGSVNMLASQTMRAWRADLTESNLFTISNATRTVLGGLQEPVTIKFYSSRALGDQAPQYGAHAERVRGLLQLYEDLAGGNLKVEVIDPQPLSDAEDRAVRDPLAFAGTAEIRVVESELLKGNAAGDSPVRELPVINPQQWLAWWGQRFMLFTHGKGLQVAWSAAQQRGGHIFGQSKR